MDPNMVLGVWKEFEFKIIQDWEHSDVLTHLRENFNPDEPIKQLLGITPERANDIDARVGHILKDNMSIVARHISTQMIAGVLVIADCAKDKLVPIMLATSPLTRIVRDLMIQLEGPFDLYTKYGIERYADFFIVSTSRQHRNVGLGSELYKKGIHLCKQMEYTLIECVFSNPFSHRIGEKLGFVELARILFSEAKDQNGTRTIPNAAPDQFVSLTVLQI